MCNRDHIWFHLTQTLFLLHYSMNQPKNCLLQGLQQISLPSHQEYIFGVHLLIVPTSCACCLHVREQPQATRASFMLREPVSSKGQKGQTTDTTSWTAQLWHQHNHCPLNSATHWWETLVLISTQKHNLAFILMMICICLAVTRWVWEVLVSGLHICFLRWVSNVAWVNKWQLLSVLESIGAVSLGSSSYTGGGTHFQSPSSSLLEQEGSCSSGTARCDSEQK